MGFWNTLSNKAKQSKMFQGVFSQQMLIPPALTLQGYLKAYGEIGWLFACVSKIGQNVGSSVWKAYKKGTNDISTSKALEVLLKPNSFQSTYELLELTQMYLDLTGKAFWYIARDKANRPREIWVVSPMWMQIVPDQQNYIKGFIYQSGAEHIPLTTDEVIFFNNPDPYNPYGGVSPAMASSRALESDKYASEWNRNFFYNSAEPQGIVNLPEDMEETDFNNWVQTWNNKYGGVGNAKKTAFIRGGEVKYTSIQINQKDMEFTNLRNMNRDEILAIYGVPKSVIGMLEQVNRATAETAEYTMAKHVITPRLRRIKDKINNEFIPLFGEEETVEIKYDDVIPQNNDFVKAVIDTQIDKCITKNEARQILNKLLGTELGDIEGGDVIWQPMGIQPMGTPMPTPTVTSQNEPVEEETPTNEDTAKQLQQDKMLNILSKKELEIRKLKIKLWLKDLDKEKYWNDFVTKAAKQEVNVSKAWTKVFDLQKQEILKRLKQQKSIKGIDTNDVIGFLKDKKHQDKIKDILNPAISKILEDKGQEALDDVGINIDFDLHNPHTQKWIKNYCGDEITQINETTRNLIKSQIEKCEEEGLSISDICDSISEYCDNMADYRIRNIARTETIGASNQGAIEGYKQSGVVEKKEWLTAIDERSREAHIEANGQVVDLDEDFEVDGEELNAPGDQKGSPENICNCRCTILPHFDD